MAPEIRHPEWALGAPSRCQESGGRFWRLQRRINSLLPPLLGAAGSLCSWLLPGSALCFLYPESSPSAPPASLLLRMLGIISQPPAEPRVLSPTPGPKFNHICRVPVTMQIKYSQVSGLRTQRSLESHLSAYHTQIRVEVIYWVRECRK